jgi:hypothetical protein
MCTVSRVGEGQSLSGSVADTTCELIIIVTKVGTKSYGTALVKATYWHSDGLR